MTITCESCGETVHTPMRGPDILGEVALQHLFRGDHVVFVGILGCVCGAKLRASNDGVTPTELRARVADFMAAHQDHEGD
jgi:hypothetical protein